MKIRVRLIGQFIERFGFSEREFELAQDATAAELVKNLGMQGLPSVVSRNGESLLAGERLNEGDRVVIAPIFSGG